MNSPGTPSRVFFLVGGPRLPAWSPTPPRRRRRRSPRPVLAGRRSQSYRRTSVIAGRLFFSSPSTGTNSSSVERQPSGVEQQICPGRCPRTSSVPPWTRCGSQFGGRWTGPATTGRRSVGLRRAAGEDRRSSPAAGSARAVVEAPAHGLAPGRKIISDHRCWQRRCRAAAASRWRPAVGCAAVAVVAQPSTQVRVDRPRGALRPAG